ncbi:hypothetical protein ACHAXR_002111, partial [Thalassiosira sp. AJA248-18]
MASRKMSKSGKRKRVADPVAAAALDALSSSSSSTSDDDAPVISRKKTPPIAAKKKTANNSRNNKSRRDLKPLFEEGDEVYAIWWPDKRSRQRNLLSQWFPGTVKSYKEIDNTSPYGPTRTYNIEYDDGDELDDVEDHFLFPHTDYILSMNKSKDLKPGFIGIGVKNRVDPKSSDFWARIVGWYVAIIDGKEQTFSLLSHAMDAYDQHVVQRKGKRTKPSDLNRPEKWLGSKGSMGDGGENKTRGKKQSTGKDRRTEKKTNPSPPTRPREEPRPEKGNNRNESAPPKKRQKISTSSYRGVTYSKQDRKYLAQINHDGKLHCLGYYKFAVDAGLAVDKGAMLGSSHRKNFRNRQAYEDAIRKENTGHSPDVVESYEAVVEKVGVYLSKIYAAQNVIESIEESDEDEETSVASDS